MSALLVENTILYPVIHPDSSAVNQLTIYMCVYFCTSSMLIAMPLLHCFDSFHLLVSLQIRQYQLSNFVPLYQSSFRYSFKF